MSIDRECVGRECVDRECVGSRTVEYEVRMGSIIRLRELVLQ